MKRVRALVAGWTLAFLLTAGNANADSLTLSSVSIDWRALTFSGISIEFVQGTFSSAADASALSGDVSDFDASTTSGWTDVSAVATASTVVGDWRAEAGALGSTTDAEISALIGQIAIFAGRASSEANANRDVNFIVRETGMLTVSAPITIETLLTVGLPEGDAAGANAYALLFLMESPNVYTVGDVGLDTRLDGVGSRSDQISRTLTVSRVFEAGQQGRFLASVHAEGFATSVPEPGTALLVGCGVAALVFRKNLGGKLTYRSARTKP
jgi:hypothetical protein